MAFDRHTLFGAGLAAIIALAVVAGITVTGGPAQARKEKQDAVRLRQVRSAAMALACYYQAKGSIPEDLSLVSAEFSKVGSDLRKLKECRSAAFSNGKGAEVAGEGFTVKRQDGAVTHICAEFATSSPDDEDRTFFSGDAVVPNLHEVREKAGEHCFELDLMVHLE